MEIMAFSAPWFIADSAEGFKGTAGTIWKGVIMIHPCTTQETAEPKLFSISVRPETLHLWVHKDSATELSFAYKE